MRPGDPRAFGPRPTRARVYVPTPSPKNRSRHPRNIRRVTCHSGDATDPMIANSSSASSPLRRTNGGATARRRRDSQVVARKHGGSGALRACMRSQHTSSGTGCAHHEKARRGAWATAAAPQRAGHVQPGARSHPAASAGTANGVSTARRYTHTPPHACRHPCTTSHTAQDSPVLQRPPRQRQASCTGHRYPAQGTRRCATTRTPGP